MKKYHYIIPYILQKIGYVIVWIAYNLFFQLEIRGAENVKNIKGPVIFASNHTSELDPPIFALILPFFSRLFPVYYVALSKERYKQFGWRSYFYGGVLFNFFGAYPLTVGKKNYEVALENHINLLKLGRTVAIFPEGKRSKDGKLAEGHGGVAYLSYTTSTPIVPIAINTFFDLSWKTFLLRWRKVVVTVGEPMETSSIVPEKNPTIDDFKRGGQRVMDRIKGLMKN